MSNSKWIKLAVLGGLAVGSVASAAFSPGIASRQFTADVANICIFQGGANPNTDIKTDGNFFSNVYMGVYRANAALTVKNVAIYDIKCTKGAAFKRGETPTVTLTRPGAPATDAKLLVKLAPTDSMTTTADGADLHSLKVDATAEAGQWAVKAGNGYTGVASWNVDYN
ncbi:hypothetical protein [Deinococcus petrolearius]|uniref:Uncharacterized protein n=1 Tax=Deinococcus petrolearius TaxID=1751295 RepID=A0ABW1DQH6_9DEIO